MKKRADLVNEHLEFMRPELRRMYEALLVLDEEVAGPDPGFRIFTIGYAIGWSAKTAVVAQSGGLADHSKDPDGQVWLI